MNVLSSLFTDCGANEVIAHGQIDFTNADTTYGQSVPVTCDTGYAIIGGHTIQCLAGGQWSKTVSCVIKGNVFCVYMYFQDLNKILSYGFYDTHRSTSSFLHVKRILIEIHICTNLQTVIFRLCSL